ncbi:MAG TPA: ABC transporter permease [Candidatus Babeliales bacterium]|nr:ABC transporter permease [Candidatus Babeliales bacterium]
MMKLFNDTSLIFFRSVQTTLRNPVWIIFGLFQPLCFLLLFAPLLEKLTSNPAFGSSNSLTVFTPGLLIMIALYGTSFVGFALIDDIRSGVIERFRVTPINRKALILGRVLRDLCVLAVQATFLLVLAWLLGLSASLFGVLISYGLVLLVGFTMSTASYCAALMLQSEDALAPAINFFLLPIQLLAGITLPLTLAPLWLQRVAFFNPFAHAVSAARSLFVGDYLNETVALGFATMMLIAALAFYGASRLLKKTAS